MAYRLRLADPEHAAEAEARVLAAYLERRRRVRIAVGSLGPVALVVVLLLMPMFVLALLLLGLLILLPCLPIAVLALWGWPGFERWSTARRLRRFADE